MDPNTTSAAYNPQIIEARKATLAEKLRRAILGRGVEESVPQEQKVLSRFNHGGHGEHGGVKELDAKSAAQKFIIKRTLSGAAEEGKVVGKAATLKGARKSRDLHDLKYGAVAHRIYDASGKSFSAKLRLRELADISIGTAKKVLREIRAGNPGLRIFRPESSPMMAQYISPHTPKKMIKAAREQLVDFQPNGRDFKLAPNSMIVPRDVARRDPDIKQHVEDMKKMVLSSIPKKLVPIQQAAYKKAESLNSPVGMALHEAGHATMPESVSKNISKLQQAAAKNGGISMTDPYFKTGIDEEYRANREVLNKIKQHGTAQEADSWRKRSQDQIKIGYRAPVFNAAMMQEASPEELEKAMAGLTPLSLKRRVLQKYPHIRKQQLSAKLRLRELAAATLIDKPLLKEDEKLLKDGAAKRALIGNSLPGALGVGVGALYGYGAHSVLNDGRADSEIGRIFPKLLKHAKSSSKGKYALIGAAAGAIPAVISYPIDYAGRSARREGLKKYPKSVGELGTPGYTKSYPENSALSTLKAYFRKKEMSAKFFGRMEDEDTALRKAGRVAGTAAIGGLAGRMAAWHPVHGGKMNRATMIGAGLGALSQGVAEHIASAKTGIYGEPVKVTDESRKSTRDIGRTLPSLGLMGAGLAASFRAREDGMDDTINEVRIRMGRNASDEYAAKQQAKARRAMGMGGETFIPKMPNFSLPFGPKSATPRSVDETGGGLEQKLERLAKSAKGTPEGEAAARKLNALRSREGKTFMGKVKKAVAKVSSKFKSGNVAPQKVIGRLLSAKLRLRELAQGFAIPPEIAAPIMARRQELMKNPDYANVQGYLVKKDNQHIMESVLKRGGKPNIRDGQVVSAYFPGKKDLSAKLRLRELARQAAYDPYAVQAQPAEPGQTGRDFRNAALGIGALGAGGGVAYAGFRGAQAAKSAQTLTDDALKTSGEARKAARSARVAAARFNRAGKVLKRQLTTFPTFKKVASKIFEEDLQSLKELADRSVELNSITYHETNADILRRKARGHREKRDESTGMWPYAVAAPGILAASPALRAESSGRVASLGKRLWKGEHADNTAHMGNKVAGILRAHPGKVVSALALAPAAVLGGNLAYHTIAARSKDRGVNKELKLANEMRRQRNAEAMKK